MHSEIARIPHNHFNHWSAMEYAQEDSDLITFLACKFEALYGYCTLWPISCTQDSRIKVVLDWPLLLLFLIWSSYEAAIHTTSNIYIESFAKLQQFVLPGNRIWCVYRLYYRLWQPSEIQSQKCSLELQRKQKILKIIGGLKDRRRKGGRDLCEVK